MLAGHSVVLNATGELAEALDASDPVEPNDPDAVAPAVASVVHRWPTLLSRRPPMVSGRAMTCGPWICFSHEAFLSSTLLRRSPA